MPGRQSPVRPFSFGLTALRPGETLWETIRDRSVTKEFRDATEQLKTTEKEELMKLYYSPGAGALASHITIRELNLDVDIVRVDVQAHKTETGDDYYEINPKGYVPYLTIDPDTDLSEGAAILQYLADQNPEGTCLHVKEPLNGIRLKNG